MSSRFVDMQQPKHRLRSLFGNRDPLKVFLQFVPGTVMDVCTSAQSGPYQNPRHINSIIAKTHTPGKEPPIKSAGFRRYYPLLRGMVDVPVKGDPILLCTMGGVNYYLGPLNTANSPNFNIDHLNRKPQLPSWLPIPKKTTNLDAANKSKNFKQTPVRRLEKKYNEELDEADKAIKDIHGDLKLEGRHANSINIGSRAANPYIFISNGRNPSWSTEVLNEGTVISITTKGTLAQHFPNDLIVDVAAQTADPDPFVIASDKVEGNERLIGSENYNYEYDKVQMLLNSDRITFNARQDSMFFSSFQHIHIGAGQTLNIKTNGETIIDSSNIYLGEGAKEEKEPLVLGEALKTVLEEIIDIFTSLKVTGTVGGVSGPVDPGTMATVQSLKAKLSKPDFFSEYHFIESNGGK